MEKKGTCPKRIAYEELNHPGVSLGEYLLQSLKKNVASCSIPAQIECESGESTSFSELLQASVQAALGLQRLGLKRGDTIAMFSRNKAELFPVLIGGVLEGITLMFLIPSSTEDEVRHFFSLTRPSAVLSEPQFNSHVALRVAAPGTLHLVTGPSGPSGSGPHSAAVTLRALLSSGSKANPDTYRPVPIPDLHEHLAFIEFSSGTSGLPKAAGLSNYGFLTSLLDLKQLWSVLPGERLLITSALSWTTGLTCTLISTCVGSTRLIANYTTEQDVLNIIERYQPNCWFIAPARLMLLADLVLSRSSSPSRPDLSSLRAVLTGGSVLRSDKQRHIAEALGVPVILAYGCTELGLISADTFPPRLGSSGYPLAGVRIRVVDIKSGEDVNEPGALGELRIKSPTCMKEYVGNPEMTAKAFDEQGYYNTGDLGYVDADGYVYVVDRIKELLKYNSMEMAPAEIEGVLLSHPDVKEACVVGRPHPRLGDLPTAFVVRLPGSTVTEQDLHKLVADRLSEFKMLRGGIYFEEELLKTSTGKLDRKEFKMRLIREQEIQSISL